MIKINYINVVGVRAGTALEFGKEWIRIPLGSLEFFFY
jgi:hypothetical protein